MNKHKKWWVATYGGEEIEAPMPEAAPGGFVVRWVSAPSGYHRETPPVATRSGAVAMWAALSGLTVDYILRPDGIGDGHNTCESCGTRSAVCETQDEANARDSAARWSGVSSYPICPQCFDACGGNPLAFRGES